MQQWEYETLQLKPCSRCGTCPQVWDLPVWDLPWGLIYPTLPPSPSLSDSLHKASSLLLMPPPLPSHGAQWRTTDALSTLFVSGPVSGSLLRRLCVFFLGRRAARRTWTVKPLQFNSYSSAVSRPQATGQETTIHKDWSVAWCTFELSSSTAQLKPTIMAANYDRHALEQIVQLLQQGA